MRWVSYLPLSILPYLAAVALQGRDFQQNLAETAQARLNAAGQGWGHVLIDGRDAQLRGTAPTEADALAGLAIVQGTPGIRRVERRLAVSGGS